MVHSDQNIFHWFDSVINNKPSNQNYIYLITHLVFIIKTVFSWEDEIIFLELQQW